MCSIQLQDPNFNYPKHMVKLLHSLQMGCVGAKVKISALKRV